MGTHSAKARRAHLGLGLVLGLGASLGLAACRSAAPSGEKGGLVPIKASQAEVDQAFEKGRLALVVGIDRFDDPGFRPLRFATRDAHDMATQLEGGGNFKVTELLQPDKKGFEAALAALAEQDRDTRDVVVVYLSTHGTLARDAAGHLSRYLVLKDTRLDRVAQTGLNLDKVQEALEALPSRRKVLVLATCHSGSGKSLLPPEVLRELEGTKGPTLEPEPLEKRSRASIVLAACDWGESAREDEQLGHDIYTHFFLEA